MANFILMCVSYFLVLWIGSCVLPNSEIGDVMKECNNKLVEQNAPRNTTCELTYKFVEKK